MPPTIAPAKTGVLGLVLCGVALAGAEAVMRVGAAWRADAKGDGIVA